MDWRIDRVLIEKAHEVVQEYYKQGVLKNKKDVIKFFKSFGLADYISFPKSCFIPFGSKFDNLILIGHDFSGYYPEI